MDPITLAALASSAIPGIAKIFGGNSQVKMAKQLDATNKFTEYQTPGQILEATKLAEAEFRNGMPGMAAAESRIGGATAGAFSNGERAATSSGDVLSLATNLNAQQDAALGGLNQEALQFRTNALGNYSNALNNEAQYADKEYQINKLDPYNRKANLAGSLYGAGQTNKLAGLDSLSTAAMAGATAYSNYKKSGS